MRIFWLIGLVLWFGLAAAKPVYHFSNPQYDKRFEQLTHDLRCLVCQNEDLAASNAALAIQLKQQVYAAIQSGQNDQAIKQYMARRYGDFVLFKPPQKRRTLALWWGPLLFLLLGLVVVIWRIRQQKGN